MEKTEMNNKTKGHVFKIFKVVNPVLSKYRPRKKENIKYQYKEIQRNTIVKPSNNKPHTQQN